MFTYCTESVRWERVESTAWAQFYSLWWGAEGERRLQRARAANVVRIDQVEVCGQLHLLTDTAGSLYLRDEVLAMYDQLVCQFQQKSDGVVCAGSPGCGKSSALIYVLLCRMAAQSPVLFSTTAGTSFFFDNSGVWQLASADIYNWPLIDEITDKPTGRFWSLIDYSADSPFNPSLNLMYSYLLFSVHAVRYESERYHDWIKHNLRSSVWLMNPWTSADLMSCLALNVRFHRLSRTSESEPVITDVVNRSGLAPLDVLREIEEPGHSSKAMLSALHGIRLKEFRRLWLSIPSPRSEVVNALFVWQRHTQIPRPHLFTFDLAFKSHLAKDLLLDHVHALGFSRSRMAMYAEAGPLALLEQLIERNLEASSIDEHTPQSTASYPRPAAQAPSYPAPLVTS